MTFFHWAVFLLLMFMFIVFVRIIKGPTVIDRLVGVNVIGTKAMILIIFFGVIYHRLDMFVDIAIAYALLNFITSVIVAKYFRKHKTLHPKARVGGNSI